MTVPDGQKVVLADDGSAQITNGRFASAEIAAPWAKDAAGNSVPTHFEVSGNKLTQVVDFNASTKFPVVADPSVSYCTIGGWYPAECVKFSKSETKTAANAYWAGASAGVAIGNLCGKIPGGIGTACKVAAAAALVTGIQNIATAAKQGKCISFKFSYPGIAQIFAGGLQIVKC